MQQEFDRLKSSTDSGNGFPSQLSALDEVVEVGRLGVDQASRERGRDLVKTFVAEVLDGSMSISKDAVAMIAARIAQIDHLVSIQLNEVLHHPAFQKLESTWRGLSYLVDLTRNSEGCKVRVLNVSKVDLLRDLQSAWPRHSSALSVDVADGYLQNLGAEPFSMLLGDYAFTQHPEDVELLERMAKVGANSHVPFLAAADPALFGGDSFPRALSAFDRKQVFDTLEYTKWRYFRRRAEARFTMLAVPRILLRKPFGGAGAACPQFRYEEGVDGTDYSKFLWGSAAWAVAAQVARAFGQGSWCADPSSNEGGGVVRKLPSINVSTDEGDIAKKGPTDAPVSDKQYQQLRDLGFTPVCQDANSSRAVVFELPTLHQPATLEDEDGELHTPPPPQFQQVFIECRIAQYIQCIVREKRAWFETPRQCERYLNRWAAKYVAGPEESDNRRPFREAEFKVVPDERRPPGWFRVVGHVTPNNKEAADAVEISVPVLLKRSAVDGHPAVDMVREDQPEQEPSHQGSGPTRAPQTADPFSAATDALERIAELRRQHALDEPDFLELKAAILGRMRRLISVPDAPADAPAPKIEPSPFSVPYSQLHREIVDLIAEPYSGGATPKDRALVALAQMDEKRALNPGDTQDLTELVETALADTEQDAAERLGAVKTIAGRIRSRRSASPACVAIADTAVQSGTRAAEKCSADQTSSEPAAGLATRIWRRLVWPDVEGAFSGGAAAATVSPALASHYLWPVQMVAAFGVVIGAGIRSGVAYGESALPANAKAV